MKILFIIATSLLVYLYWTELISPWLKSKKEKNTILELKKLASKLEDQYDAFRYSAVNTDVYTNYFNNATFEPTVSITKPVLLVGKGNNLKIYHPDNSVEIYSNRWKRYQTPHASVYSYATATKSNIIENID